MISLVQLKASYISELAQFAKAMENQITASRLLADDGDIMTLEGLLKQSRISDGRADEAEIEIYAEDVYFGDPALHDRSQRHSVPIKASDSYNAEKNTQNARVQAQIELNKQRLSAYDQIFGALTFSPHQSIDMGQKSKLSKSPKLYSAAYAIEPNAQINASLYLQAGAAAKVKGIKSRPADEQRRYPNLTEKSECEAPAEGIIQISLAKRKGLPKIVPSASEFTNSEQQAPGVVLFYEDAPASRIASETASRTRDSKIARWNARTRAETEVETETEDFEPLAVSVAGSHFLYSIQRRRVDAEKHRREITKNMFSELQRTIRLSKSISEAKHTARESANRPKAPACSAQTPRVKIRQNSGCSTAAQSRARFQGQRSLSVASKADQHGIERLQGSMASTCSGIRPRAGSKNALKVPQKCASVQPQRKKWYPTPESDIYARAQQRRLLFERKLQKLREECAPREEEFSFAPTISYKGRNYKYVPETSRFRVSRTLQEYLQQKREQFTFRPQITAAPLTASRASSTPRAGSRPASRVGGLQEFTFQPTINNNYRVKTPRTGDAGSRQYGEYMQRMNDQKSINVAYPADRLTKSQLYQFFQRQSEFLARKQRLLREFELAEAQKCTFQPAINTSRAAAANDQTGKPGSACGQKQAYSCESSKKQPFTPRIDKYSQKIVYYSGRKPIAQTSIYSFRERQIKLRYNERARMLREFKDEHANQAEERRYRPAQLTRHALIGDKCW